VPWMCGCGTVTVGIKKSNQELCHKCGLARNPMAERICRYCKLPVSVKQHGNHYLHCPKRSAKVVAPVGKPAQLPPPLMRKPVALPALHVLGTAIPLAPPMSITKPPMPRSFLPVPAAPPHLSRPASQSSQWSSLSMDSTPPSGLGKGKGDDPRFDIGNAMAAHAAAAPAPAPRRTLTSAETQAAATSIATVLAHGQVPDADWAFGGSFALQSHGAARLPHDIDIVVNVRPPSPVGPTGPALGESTDYWLFNRAVRALEGSDEWRRDGESGRVVHFVGVGGNRAGVPLDVQPSGQYGSLAPSGIVTHGTHRFLGKATLKANKQGSLPMANEADKPAIRADIALIDQLP
jgi:hypothetical protein